MKHTEKRKFKKFHSLKHQFSALFIGLLLLFALMIVVTFSDIRKLITG